MRLDFSTKLTLEALDHDFHRNGRDDLSKYCQDLCNEKSNHLTFQALIAFVAEHTLDEDAVALLLISDWYCIGNNRNNINFINQLKKLHINSENPLLLTALGAYENTANQGDAECKADNEVKLAQETALAQTKYFFPHVHIASFCSNKLIEILNKAINHNSIYAAAGLIAYTLDNKELDRDQIILPCIHLIKKQLETYSSPIGCFLALANANLGRLYLHKSEDANQRMEGIHLMLSATNIFEPTAIVELTKAAISLRKIMNLQNQFSVGFFDFLFNGVERNYYLWHYVFMLKEVFGEELDAKLKLFFEKLKKCMIEEFALPIPDPLVLANLGMCYRKGFGTEQSFKAAALCFEVASKLNLDYADLEMARCHFRGEGVETSPKKALFYYERAKGNDLNTQGLDSLETLEPIQKEVQQVFQNSIPSMQAFSDLIAEYSIDEDLIEACTKAKVRV